MLSCNRLALGPTTLRLIGGRSITAYVLANRGGWKEVGWSGSADTAEVTVDALMCLGGKSVSGAFASLGSHFLQIRAVPGAAFHTSSPEQASVWAKDAQGNWAPAFLPLRPDSGSYAILTFSPNDATRRAQAAAVIAKDAARRLTLEKRAADAHAQTRERELARRRETLLARGWSRSFVDLVLRREVAIGMTRAMVEASWGRPEGVNTTTTASGTSEQWVYGSSYLYFSNGVLTTIQQSR